MWRPAIVLLLSFSVVTGVVYPALVTGVAQLVFPEAAAGSPVRTADGGVIGSRLVGQSFTAPRYLWGRPSATSPAYAASASSGSNLGPSSAALDSLVRARVAALQASVRAAGLPTPTTPVPVDLVTASGSGLDPDISPAAADWQAARVAQLRGLPLDTVQAIIRAHTTAPWLGLFGSARVNVLAVNLALDARTR